MNPTEQQLTTLFRDSTTELTPDVGELVAGGIARGRTRRRRQGVGTALAAAAVIGVIGVAASVAPGLMDEPNSAPGFADNTVLDPVQPKHEPVTPPDVVVPRDDLAVAAEDIPAQIASMLPAGELGPVLTDDPYPLVNTRDERIVHFLWDGTLTTFIIERASGLGTCEQSAADFGTCQVVDGLETLTWGPTTADQVTAQGVEVWQHGYVVTAISYNALEGKLVEPLMDAPAISLEQLTQLARSEVWFG